MKNLDMRRYMLYGITLLFLVPMTIVLTGCSKESEKLSVSDIWDIDKRGIPKFVENNYIELDKIYRISKFRSSVGHDYSDAFEHCRSMKHYFEPQSIADWSSVKIFSPVTGIITRAEMEWAGLKVEIESEKYPAFRFSIFHINSSGYDVGDSVEAGEQLGTHIGLQTMSDISVIVNDPTRQGRMVSYFEVITDAVFQEYANRGLLRREDVIIPKATRDTSPLSCNGDAFVTTDSLENWVILE